MDIFYLRVEYSDFRALICWDSLGGLLIGLKKKIGGTIEEFVQEFSNEILDYMLEGLDESIKKLRDVSLIS